MSDLEAKLSLSTLLLEKGDDPSVKVVRKPILLLLL